MLNYTTGMEAMAFASFYCDPTAALRVHSAVIIWPDTASNGRR